MLDREDGLEAELTDDWLEELSEEKLEMELDEDELEDDWLEELKELKELSEDRLEAELTED